MNGEGSSFDTDGAAWTVGSLWYDIAGRPLGDELLAWAPDLFAFTDVVLDRSEAYRFAVSPPAGTSWPPPEMPDWHRAIAEASVGWCAWVEGDGTELPGLAAAEWAVVRGHSATPLDEVATGRAWRICQALITLHAIADEACAGTGVAVLDVPHDGTRFRGRARELLARTGTLSRISRQRLRVLPCVRSSVGGPSIRSLSRYVCVRGPAVDAVWHRIPAGTVGPGGPVQDGNVLMLPWPLRIHAADFKPAGTVERGELEPYGFFDFEPRELLDLDLADRVLQSARDQHGSVDIVVLPESELRPGDVDELEALLTRHHVWLVVAGVREPPRPGGRFGANSDGRPPVANTANVSAEGVSQIRALDPGDLTDAAMPEAPADSEPAVSLEAVELTILTCWAEAVAEVLAAAPDQLSTILDDARAGAPWRRQLGVAEPSADLTAALDDLARVAVSPSATDEPSRGGYSHLVRAVLRSKLG